MLQLKEGGEEEGKEGRKEFRKEGKKEGAKKKNVREVEFFVLLFVQKMA